MLFTLKEIINRTRKVRLFSDCSQLFFARFLFFLSAEERRRGSSQTERGRTGQNSLLYNLTHC